MADDGEKPDAEETEETTAPVEVYAPRTLVSTRKSCALLRACALAL